MQVMIDIDLAELYGVENRALKQAIKRNIDKFPDDFMFILSDNEIISMVSWGSKPYAFTEQGVAMLSSVLKSKIATKISINIFRAFVNMRKVISQNALIFQKFEYIEQKLLKSDENFDKIFKALESKKIQ